MNGNTENETRGTTPAPAPQAKYPDSQRQCVLLFESVAWTQATGLQSSPCDPGQATSPAARFSIRTGRCKSVERAE